MKCPLSTMTKFIDVVISLKDYDAEEIQAVGDNLNQWCAISCDMFAFILHDKDVNDDGVVKTPHYHLVAQLRSNKKRLTTTINDIAEIVGVCPCAITIEKLVSMSGGIQYLTHKNDINKYQYDINDIVTNLGRSELELYYNDDKPSFSIDTIVNAINHHNGRRLAIMREIGLSYYHTYNKEINDLIREYEINGGL